MRLFVYLFDKKSGFRIIVLLVVALFCFNVGPILFPGLFSQQFVRSIVRNNRIAQLVYLSINNQTDLFYHQSTSTVSTTTRNISRSEQFDEECDRTGEWQSISNHAYFKRAAAFYFADANLLNMYYLRLGTRSHAFALHVVLFQANKPVAEFNVSNTTSRHIWSASKYFFGVLNANFSGIKIDSTKLSTYKMQVLVKDVPSGQQADTYMNIKIKNLKTESSAKKGSILCAKCFHLTHKDDYLSMKWWVEVSKQAGFDKVSICDQQIEDHPSFRSLFKKNEDFLIVNKLRCIPNLQALPKYLSYKYLKTYAKMEWSGTGIADINKMDNLNMLIINECYMENMDKYRYIASIDNDEVIISNWAKDYFSISELITHVNNVSTSYSSVAKNDFSINVDSIITNFQCNRYQSESNSSVAVKTNKSKEHEIEDFLTELIKKSQFQTTKPSSYFFNQGYFLENVLVDQIFKKLEEVLKEVDVEKILNATQNSPVSVYLNVTDYNRPKESFTKGPHPFSVTIKSQRELKYAINLLKVYKTYFKPYLDENAALFLNQTKDFDRFFAIVGHINNFALGKTLHNSDVSFDISLHMVENYFDISQNPPQVKYDKANWRLNYFPYDLSHLSHFRKVQYFSYKEVPFEFLVFNLNYFNCYFRPILARFLREPI